MSLLSVTVNLSTDVFLTLAEIMLESGRARFDRCLTPMGTVPISVIYGFKYVEDKQRSPAGPSQTSLTAPSRGTTRPAPVWPSGLSSRRQEVGVTCRERTTRTVEPTSFRTTSPAPAKSPAPPAKTSYTSYNTLRSRELPKRSYLSSWRESVR